MSDDRQLVVTVIYRFRLDALRREYEENLAPDCGFTGTFEEWIQATAEGTAKGARGAAYDAEFEASHEIIEGGE